MLRRVMDAILDWISIVLMVFIMVGPIAALVIFGVVELWLSR